MNRKWQSQASLMYRVAYIFHLYVICNIFLVDFYGYLIKTAFPEVLYDDQTINKTKDNILNETFLNFATRFFEAFIAIVIGIMLFTYKFVKQKRKANREKAYVLINKIKKLPPYTWQMN